MDNPMKGEVTLQAGSVTYKLVMGTNAMCCAEATLDMGFPQILQNLSRFTYARALLCAALQEHHKGTTLEETGRIMDAAGIGSIGPAIIKAVNAGSPPQDDSAPKNG